MKEAATLEMFISVITMELQLLSRYNMCQSITESPFHQKLNSADKKEFFREAQLLSQIRHPNVVRVTSRFCDMFHLKVLNQFLGIFSPSGQDYIVTECMEQGSVCLRQNH